MDCKFLCSESRISIEEHAAWSMLVHRRDIEVLRENFEVIRRNGGIQ